MQLDQILQGANIWVLLGVGCCGLCVVGLILSAVAPIFDLIGGLLELIVNLVTGLFGVGPIPGCGCAVLIAVVGGVLLIGAFLAAVLSTCGTTDATNFCTLFGR